MDKQEIQNQFMSLQDRICSGLEELDGKAKFQEEKWERDGGGGGRTRVIGNGRILEKGGVNFSAVHGPTPQNILKALNLEPADFFATGVSIVIHPNHPFVPIIHMNVRYFEMSNGIYWFGGGIDLTPHYVFDEDAQYFHKEVKQVCDRYSSDFYDDFKKWADEYFYINHRQETRGVGGIFYDRLNHENSLSKKELLNFSVDIGDLFVPVYSEIVKKNQELSFTDANKEWQYVRRGRYAEFNLVYDKGTKFGLDTNGRTESILMSLPPTAKWFYDHKPLAGSPEAETLEKLKKGVNWLEIMEHSYK